MSSKKSVLVCNSRFWRVPMPSIPNRNKIEELIGILLTGTKKRILKWDTTADENTFRLASPTANVRVTRSEGYHPEAPGETLITRGLSVLNDKGRVIEEYSPNPYDADAVRFDSLYSVARREA